MSNNQLTGSRRISTTCPPSIWNALLELYGESMFEGMEKELPKGFIQQVFIAGAKQYINNASINNLKNLD